jgi:hypothetical protein
MALQSFCWTLFAFSVYTQLIGLLGRGISRSQGRYLTQTHNKYKQTYMPRVGFEPTITTFEWAKTVHALDLAASVIGIDVCKGH